LPAHALQRRAGFKLAVKWWSPPAPQPAAATPQPGAAPSSGTVPGVIMNPSARFWVPLFTALGALLTTVLINRFSLDAKWIFVFAPAIAAILLLSFDWFVHTLLNVYYLRRKLDTRSKFEGVWLAFYPVDKQLCDDEIIYAGFSIKYTGDSTCPYAIKGDAYYPDGKTFAEWRSVNIHFNLTDNMLEYFYRGRVFTQHDVRGFGSLSFNVTPGYIEFPKDESTAHVTTRRATRKATKDDTTLPHSGTGFFVDDSAEGSKRTVFSFVRITSDLMLHIFRNDHVRNFEIEREFVRRIHSKYGRIIKNKNYLMVSDVVAKSFLETTEPAAE
jgi:hypothetical protein